MKRIVLMIAMIFFISTASSLSWQDLWLRADQQAAKALQQGNPKQAAILFSEPNWKGVAFYRASAYAQALSQFKQRDSSDNYYNQGNTLAKMQHYQAAIKAYNQAIKLNPNNEDAIYNCDLLGKLLKKQSSQQQQSNDVDPRNQAKQHDQQHPEKQKVQQQKNTPIKTHTMKPEQTTQEKEEQQTNKQWLRRVPDDPGALLKQIFLRDYLRQQQR